MYKYTDEGRQHLHSYEGKPLIGTSKIPKVLNKPALTYWASGMAVSELGWLSDKKESEETRLKEAGRYLQAIKKLNEEDYLKLLDKAYKSHSTNLKKTAEKGTDLHAELERFCYDKMNNRIGVYEERIMPFIKWSNENVKRFIHSEVHVYSLELWLGGITDCVAELNDGQIVIIDFKSAKEAYVDHALQIAGYDLQAEENGYFDSEGVKIGDYEKVSAYGVVPFGAENVEPVFFTNLSELKEQFKNCVSLHKFLEQYNQYK